MKAKKIIIGVIITLIVIGSGATYYILNKEDKNTTLNIMEKQWIESNKSKVIDLSILNNIPILNYDGEGLFFDYIKSLEEATGLEFNKVASKETSEIKTEYAFREKEEITDNDILIYEDNYAILTKEQKKYSNLSELNNMVIGVLETDLEDSKEYLSEAENINFKTFKNSDELIENLTKKNELNAIILPKIQYLEQIIKNQNLNIAYNITEMKKNYVLSLGNIDKLNDILKKYYKKWKIENYDESYNQHFSDDYLTFASVDDKQKVEFRSKRYAYGFIENKPYDALVDNKLLGINNSFMKEFAKLSNVEISFTKYDNIGALINDFNSNKLDIFFNNTIYNKFDMDTYNLVSTYDEQAVILADPNNNITINSIKSLIGKEVAVVENTQLADYLSVNGAYIKTYKTIDDLVSKVDKNSVIALDSSNYNYYISRDLSKYKNIYNFYLPSEYTFTVRDINDNSVFINFFNFYLSFISEKSLIDSGYADVESIRVLPPYLKYVLIVFLSLLLIGFIIFIWFKVLKPKFKTKVHNLSKEDKLKYIDVLTSLKNRNYLNDNIETWDNSEVYPQTIIIIDLNNVTYVNDNYGHAEGDKLILEAANILITTQIPNSEIMRTDGNEFLVYAVQYNEKQIVSYIRKLTKEFKNISHNFGAAIGYSMITDGIKTIDDAINEATLDMKSNKEEANN